MHFCAIRDGAPYSASACSWSAGGTAPSDEGLYFLNLGVAELTVVEIMDRFFAASVTQDALLGDPRVKGFKTTKVVDVEVTDGKLSAAILENAQTGERTALPPWTDFRLPRPVPGTTNGSATRSPSMTARLIPVGEDMSTNIPGVSGAGRHQPQAVPPDHHGGQRRYP